MGGRSSPTVDSGVFTRVRLVVIVFDLAVPFAEYGGSVVLEVTVSERAMEMTVAPSSS
jgi:hypothetical protein